MIKSMLKIKTLFTRKKLIVFFIIAILLVVPIGIIDAMMNTELRFSPTMEEAFSRHSSGRHEMGEILFIDDHGYNLTIFHVLEVRSGRRTRFVSHYIREFQYSDWVYLCIGVNIRSFILNNNEASIYMNTISMENLFIPISRTFERILMNHPFNRIDRWPLYGYSNYSNIHNLVINGQSPDYIIDAGFDVQGEQMYFWYFSDFMFNDGDRITISFEG